MTLDSSAYRNWKSWDADTFGRYSSVDAVTFRRELEIAGVLFSEPISLLEIGFGNGYFAKWANDQGWNVVGTELDRELVDRAVSIGIEAYWGDSPIDEIGGGQKFDVIACFDVLEHLTIEEIIAMLAAARRCLKSDGLLIARFPSGDSPFARSLQHSDITHRTVIGAGIIRQLAQETGFGVLQIRPPAFPIFRVGLIRGLRRIAVLSVRAVISAAVNVVFHDAESLVIARNMVVVLQPCGDVARRKA